MKSSLTGMLVAALLLAAMSASAQQSGRTAYKCVHADGRIEYAALPLDGAECERISGRLPGEVAPAPEPPPPEVSESEAEVEAVDPRGRNCELARNNVEILEGEGAVAVTDEAGETVLLDAERRAAALQQARRDVDYWCE